MSTLIRSGKLRYAKAESIRLLAWMYYAPAVPCLYRKRTKAEGFLSSLRKAAGHPTGAQESGGCTMASRTTRHHGTKMPEWWNWQARRPQKPLPARACGFDSRLRHQSSFLDTPLARPVP